MTHSIRINIVSMLSLGAILFSACQQVELPNETAALDQNDIVYAAIEDEPDTKTYLDGKKVVWSSGDEIVAFMGKTLRRKYVVSSETVGTTEGSFVRDNEYEHIGASGTLSSNIAFYPFAEITCKAEGQSCILENISLPSVQTYAPDSFGPNSFPMMAVSADTDDVDFRFKNLCGALKLQLQGEGVIRSITIKGNSDEILAGPASVTMSRGEEPSISLASDGLKEVTLDCSEGVSLTADTPTAFLIALPPTVFSNGFTVTVTDTWGSVREFSTTSQNVILRSGILKMPVKVYTRPPQPGDYYDEYGVNHGQGIKIGKTVWAPVNCGYHKDDFKYGKQYQWGRKYGQGYTGQMFDGHGNTIQEYSDAVGRTTLVGPVSLEEGQSPENKNVRYNSNREYDFDWLYPHNDMLWNSGTEENPVKTEYDPCPEGWRVPTYAELKELNKNCSTWTANDEGQYGYWFSGPESYNPDVPQIFLSAAGNDCFLGRGHSGNYWSSKPAYTYRRSAYNLSFAVNFNHISELFTRSDNYSVRCVQE